MWYLQHEQVCFIKYEPQSAAERFIFDKVQPAGVLNIKYAYT